MYIFNRYSGEGERQVLMGRLSESKGHIKERELEKKFWFKDRHEEKVLNFMKRHQRKRGSKLRGGHLFS